MRLQPELFNSGATSEYWLAIGLWNTVRYMQLHGENRSTCGSSECTGCYVCIKFYVITCTLHSISDWDRGTLCPLVKALLPCSVLQQGVTRVGVTRGGKLMVSPIFFLKKNLRPFLSFFTHNLLHVRCHPCFSAPKAGNQSNIRLLSKWQNALAYT